MKVLRDTVVNQKRWLDLNWMLGIFSVHHKARSQSTIGKNIPISLAFSDFLSPAQDQKNRLEYLVKISGHWEGNDYGRSFRKVGEFLGLNS